MTLIKWVRCLITDPEKFHTGQSRWSAAASSPGFLGQLGGHENDEAHIFGLWQDEPGYAAFMAGPHDGLAAAQAGAYEKIEVRLFEALQLTRDLTAAGLLRLAHCQVKADQVPDFVRAQRTIWTPGMAAAPGFTGCAFAVRAFAVHAFAVREATEFLVLSGWQTAADHDRYRRDHFPSLHRRSQAATHLTTIDGRLITADAQWTVKA